jgi:hypothetical protein
MLRPRSIGSVAALIAPCCRPAFPRAQQLGRAQWRWGTAVAHRSARLVAMDENVARIVLFGDRAPTRDGVRRRWVSHSARRRARARPRFGRWAARAPPAARPAWTEHRRCRFSSAASRPLPIRPLPPLPLPSTPLPLLPHPFEISQCENSSNERLGRLGDVCLNPTSGGKADIL